MATSRRSARLSAQFEDTQSTAAASPTNAAASKKRKTAPKGSTNGIMTPEAPSARRGKPAAATMPPPPVPPSTPQSKRRRRADPAAGNGIPSTPPAPPPLTPTPSAVGIIAAGKAPPSLPRTPSQVAARAPRRAEPHATNAPLATPGGSRVVAFPPVAAAAAAAAVPSSSPGRVSLMLPLTTTETLLAEAEAHIVKVDPSLRSLVERHKCKLFSPAGLQEEIEPFRALASGIIAQQVSGEAANSIKKKFIGLYPSCTDIPGAFPTPAEVAGTDHPTLRTAGLSGRKAEYIQGLAEKFESGELSAEMLVRASDEKVLERLVAVRGLGKWSVEMFACFALKRMDVFSTGDLAVQRGVAAYLGRDTAKLKNKGGKWKYCSEQEMLDAAEKFAPYRSLFMWYMWRIEDQAGKSTDINAIADED